MARLHAAGRAVRATARSGAPDRPRPAGSPESPNGVEGVGAIDVVDLDLTATDGFEAALKDVESVFLYATRGDTTPFLAAAREADVRYAVLLSSPASYEAAEYRGPIGRVHRLNEERLAASGLEHTVLYPSWLATNARRDWGAAIRAGEPVELPYPDANISPIHPDDVAAVAAELLRDPAHRSRMQILTGPESLRLDEAAAVVGTTLGRPVDVRRISRDQALARREAWLSEEVLATLLDSAAATVGHPATLTNGVERITGRPPRSLREWVEERRTDFGPE
ncbi:NAD(P)H-binding protein [Catenulispora yoronensis]|uniref:NAD(P)H-binding protein n=1 Tax=Catenulispora yoronensis TaxID=450799 RepID=A0ABP5FAJ8_9ACTN